MALRGPRFSGDPVLEACLAGTHRMLAPEDGLAVLRVQHALLELGHSVGAPGADGRFGGDTGTAVTAYKTDHGLQPNDPVVGPGTMGALDADLFVDPPSLDPAFAEFALFVVGHRVEPFAGRELAALIGTPLDSWRRMTAMSALTGLNAAQPLGIVARSRADDLRAAFLAVAAPTQALGVPAEAFFAAMTAPGAAPGSTISFVDQAQTVRSFVLVGDDVILGRQFIGQLSTGRRAPVTLGGVLTHELNHVRNEPLMATLLLTADTDTDVYTDTALASVSPGMAATLRSFASEICARHAHWIMDRELAGNPFAARFLAPEALLEAVRFYFADTVLFVGNGYVPAVAARGDTALYDQVGRWLRTCAAFAFSDDPAEDARTRTLFTDTADLAFGFSANPPAARPAADGLFPLPADFS